MNLNLIFCNKRSVFFLYILQFILITYSLIVAHNSPAKGYEASVYTGTPLIVWFSLGFCIFLSVVIVISQIVNEHVESKNLWIFGLLIIYIVYVIALSLFVIRNYYGWSFNGDPGAHIGHVKSIVESGHIPDELFYPFVHVYASQISLILNLDIIILHKYIPLLFGMLYVPFMYIFSKSILPNRAQLILTTVASMTFINGWYLNFTPNALANHFIPLFLFIFLKILTKTSAEWEILIVILVFMFPIFHPVPTLFLIILLVFFHYPSKLLSVLKINSKTSINDCSIRTKHIFKFTLVLLLFVWGVTWISSFGVWDRTIRNISILINEGGTTKLDSLVSDVHTAEGYGYNVIDYVIKTLGSTAIYFLVSLLCIPLLLKERRLNYSSLGLKTIFSLYGPLFCTVLFFFLLYFLNLAFGPLRIIYYIVVICTIFIGYFLNHEIRRVRYQYRGSILKIVCLCIIFMLVGVFFNGMMLLYPSNYKLESNPQTTETSFEGIKWFFKTRNIDMEITGMYIVPYKFALILLIPVEKIQMEWTIPKELAVPYHFGYNNYSSLSESYIRKNDLYLAITERDKVTAEKIFPDIAKDRWTLSDFEKLNFDSSLDKIYSSNGFELYYVNCRYIDT